MSDRTGWLGMALAAVFRARGGRRASLENLHQLTDRIDQRANDMASAITDISERLKG